MPLPITQIILKMADICNLNCSYCYYYTPSVQDHVHRAGLMTRDTLQRLLLRVRVYCERCHLTDVGILFHGGEPLVVGVSIYAELFAMAKELIPSTIRIHWSITTNGTLLSKSFISLFKQEGVSITVSMDGPEQAQDRFRVTHNGSGSYKLVMEKLGILRDSGLDLKILCVVNPDFDGRDTYRFFRSLGAKCINFLLPDYSYDTFPHGDLIAYNARCFAFMKTAFDTWFDEDDPTIEVSYFRDLIRIFVGGRASLCTLQASCPNFVTVEHDGRVHHCDVARLCGEENYLTGLSLNGELDAINQNHFHKTLMSSSSACSTCKSCDLFFACGGHCPGTRYSSARGLDNVSIFCGFFKEFIPYVRKRVRERIPPVMASRFPQMASS